VGAQQPLAKGDDLDVVQLRPNFYMIAGAGGNIAVQIGSIGVVLVDDGTEAASGKVLAAIARLTDKPIRYIINTSADLDHVGGNEKVAKAGETILSGAIGQRGIDEDALTNNGAASSLAHESVLARMSVRGGPSIALWPTKVYTGRSYAMALNDEGIQVFHEAAAHSDGDSILVFRHADVVVTGDIVDLRRFPVVDPATGGGIQGEIDALNHILDLVIPPFPLIWDPARTLVIPGHGRVMDHSDLVEYRDMVTIVRDIVQDMVKRGMTLEQVKAANPTEAYRKRFGADTGPWTTDMFVEAVYKGLTAKKK
jgi:cyclase